MNIYVVIGHQNQGSFNHAIAAAIVEELRTVGHEVVFHDLYAEGFDPILRQEEITGQQPLEPIVTRHIDEVMAADGYVVVHPNWWGQPPAILRGWQDRVLRQGTVYEFGPNGVIGHLKGKRALVITTSNTPREIEQKVFGDPLENLWKTCVFGFCGLVDFRRRNFESIVLSTPEQRADWLEETRRLAREWFPGT